MPEDQTNTGNSPATAAAAEASTAGTAGNFTSATPGTDTPNTAAASGSAAATSAGTAAVMQAPTAETVKARIAETGNHLANAIDSLQTHHEAKGTVSEQILAELKEARECVYQLVQKLLAKI